MVAKNVAGNVAGNVALIQIEKSFFVFSVVLSGPGIEVADRFFKANPNDICIHMFPQ